MMEEDKDRIWSAALKLYDQGHKGSLPEAVREAKEAHQVLVESENRAGQ